MLAALVGAVPFWAALRAGFDLAAAGLAAPDLVAAGLASPGVGALAGGTLRRALGARLRFTEAAAAASGVGSAAVLLVGA